MVTLAARTATAPAGRGWRLLLSQRWRGAVDRSALLARLGAGPSGLTTVPVGVGPAGFTLTRRDGTVISLDGARLARLLAACLPAAGPGIQLAVGWPATRRHWPRLRTELQRLAHRLDAVVWAPEQGGVATVLPGCADLAAVDASGTPMGWRAYLPRHTGAAPTALKSDPDGRLMPSGGITVTAFPGGPLVSVPKGQLAMAWGRYEQLVADPAWQLLDLGLLPDGRLGLSVDSGALVAAGPRQLQRVLRHGGWDGQDLLLLVQPGQVQWPVTADHAGWLAGALGVAIWLSAPGATWSVDSGGRVRSSARPEQAGWHRAGVRSR